MRFKGEQAPSGGNPQPTIIIKVYSIDEYAMNESPARGPEGTGLESQESPLPWKRRLQQAKPAGSTARTDTGPHRDCAEMQSPSQARVHVPWDEWVYHHDTSPDKDETNPTCNRHPRTHHTAGMVSPISVRTRHTLV